MYRFVYFEKYDTELDVEFTDRINNYLSDNVNKFEILSKTDKSIFIIYLVSESKLDW